VAGHLREHPAATALKALAGEESIIAYGMVSQHEEQPCWRRGEMQMLQLEGDQKSVAGSLTHGLFPPKCCPEKDIFAQKSEKSSHQHQLNNTVAS